MKTPSGAPRHYHSPCNAFSNLCLGLSTDDIHFVELVGDATRTPIVLELTKQAFNKKELFRTLNSLETIGRGAALQSAMLSPLFSVQSFIVEEYNALPVSITYRFGQEGTPVTKELFKKGSMFPLSKTVTFDNKLGDMDLLVHYSKDQAEILKGLPDQIAQYMVKGGKPKHAESPLGGSKVKFQFKVCNNIHQIPCLESTELIEEWNEEEKIAIKKPAAPKPAEPKPEGAEEKKEGEGAAKEGEPQPATEQAFETKTRKKTASYPLAFDTQVHSLAPAVRAKFVQLEKDLTVADRKFLDLKEAKNDLEAYSYEFRNNLQEYGNYEKYALKEVREPFIAQINEAVDWLYGAGENASLEEYTSRLRAFQAIGAPIKKRYVFYSMIEESQRQFATVVAKIEAKLAEAEMSDENRKQVLDKVGVVREFMDKLAGELASRPRTEDASVTLEQVDMKIALLDSECKGIFALPPPKKEQPKKEGEEAATEDAAAAKEDVEMKQEESQ